MKKRINYICYLAILIALCFQGCFEDKDQEYLDLNALKISFEGNQKSYNAGLGDLLTITPIIETQITDSDLKYEWEVYSNFDFHKFSEGAQFNDNFGPNEYIPAPGIYIIRLHAFDIKDNRHFYSEQITVNVSGGKTGLLVLHASDDTACDIGLIIAPEFLPTRKDIEIQNVPNWYEQANNEKIKGKGVAVVHAFTSYTDPSRCYVAALTSEGGVVAGYEGLVKLEDYKNIFYGGLNKNKPEGYIIIDDMEFAIDGGELFMCTPSMDTYFVTSIFPENYNIAPYVFYMQSWSAQAQLVCFDRTSRAFMGLTNIWGTKIDYFPMSAQTGNTAFDPGNTKADLIHFDRGGKSPHFLAVMKDVQTENLFLAEMDLENSSMEKIPVAKYDMSRLTNINDAKFHAFGDNQINMCYYATNNAVYQYTVAEGNALQAKPLSFVDGRPITLEGEVTMMKILKPYRLEANMQTGVSPFDYYNYNKILLVGTYNGGQGVLHSYLIDEISGQIISETSYAGYDKIIDANIKGL